MRGVLDLKWPASATGWLGRTTENCWRKQPHWITPRQDGPLALARQPESEALAEYSRILKIFTGLTIYGRIPEEELSGVNEGGL